MPTTAAPPRVPGDEPEHLVAGLALGLLGVAAFSLTLPMTRIAVAEIDATSVALWRGIVAASLSLVILLVRRPARPRGRQWFWLAGCAFGTVFGFPWFTTLAMQTVTASHGAVVIGLLPLATAVASALLGGERPSAGFWAVAVLGTALTIAFVLRQADGGLAAGHLFLGLAVLTAAIGYTAGGLLARTLGGWVVACWSLVLCLPAMLLATPMAAPPALDATPAAIGAFLYVAVFSQLVGFFAWYRGMALAGIARVAQLQLLQLFMTLGFAALLLREGISTETVLFGAAVIACVAIGTRLRVNAVPGPDEPASRA